VAWGLVKQWISLFTVLGLVKQGIRLRGVEFS
jgi:hypothetical protein